MMDFTLISHFSVPFTGMAVPNWFTQSGSKCGDTYMYIRDWSWTAPLLKARSWSMFLHSDAEIFCEAQDGRRYSITLYASLTDRGGRNRVQSYGPSKWPQRCTEGKIGTSRFVEVAAFVSAVSTVHVRRVACFNVCITICKYSCGRSCY